MERCGITNPETGGVSFGIVPQVEIPGRGHYAQAEIRLFPGRHASPGRGFGANHIWAAHEREMRQSGFTLKAEVADYVASIVREGTRLYYEGGHWKRLRLLAVRSSAGTAVLEFRRQRSGPVWSVVTAHSGKTPHGTLIGAVRAAQPRSNQEGEENA